ncbi:MAG: hypothetical protein ACUVXA_11420 [Candidatus Jordarchaeum sp.]|uniref:hypothetical protein n=1 Tax=Candidatus Jordarchaeum sp. TaxID=2823881 RepID=UPI00404A9009
MFLDEDLDLQKAWKRLIAILFILMIPAFLSFVWFGFSNVPKMYPLWDSQNIMLFLRVSDLSVSVELGSSMLFNTVNVSGIVLNLIPVMFFWIVFTVIGAYYWIIMRLARDGSFWFSPLGTRPSNRYQTFGEAKKRLREIVGSGTGDERSALYLFVIFYVVGFSSTILIILLGFVGIFELFEALIIWLVFLVLNIIPEWRMWNKIR